MTTRVKPFIDHPINFILTVAVFLGAMIAASGAFAFGDVIGQQQQQEQEQGQDQKQFNFNYSPQELTNKPSTTFEAEKNYNQPGGLGLGASSFGNVAQDCIVTTGDALGLGGGGAWTGGALGITGASGLYSTSETIAWYNVRCGLNNAENDMRGAGPDYTNAVRVLMCMDPIKAAALAISNPGACNGVAPIKQVLIPIQNANFDAAFADEKETEAEPVQTASRAPSYCEITDPRCDGS